MEKQVEQICNMFFEVSNIPLTICREDGEALYWVPTTAAPEVPTSTHRAFVERFKAATTSEEKLPFVEITHPTFFFAILALPPGHYLILGPVAPTQPNPPTIKKLAVLQNVPPEKNSDYCERIKDLPVFSYRQFLTTIALVNYLFSGNLISPEDILPTQPPAPKDVERRLTQALFNAREKQIMHTPASFEHYILQAIQDGNVPKLKQALLAPVSGSIGKMSEDPIQQEKYTFICFITLVTRAAIAGGLNPELTFSLSDIYCQRVDRSQNISEIAGASWEMCMDFAGKVAAVKGYDKLSPGISMCCEYINGHLHEDVSLSQLADIVRMNSKSFSKKFKQETGLSVGDYIHQERIKEAQALLEFSGYSISEIGYHLQYGSQSYFSSIFKKFSGVTPQQFRSGLAGHGRNADG